MNAGRLIAFEGLDGSGKSTQLARLAEHLTESIGSGGPDIVVTKEPTEGPVGKKIRAMAQSGERVPPERELAWFMEDRREHVDTLLEPALAASAIVLCDRYSLSTVAYQGARGLDRVRCACDLGDHREAADPDSPKIEEVVGSDAADRDQGSRRRNENGRFKRVQTTCIEFRLFRRRSEDGAEGDVVDILLLCGLELFRCVGRAADGQSLSRVFGDRRGGKVRLAEVNGIGLLGGFSHLSRRTDDDDSPLLRIRGLALMGGVEVKVKK